MKITSETATALGEKLASLDLTPEEAVLLSAMLEEEDEVSGFLNFEEIKVTYRAPIYAPVRHKFEVAEKHGYTEVEWTY